jgi:hypothetical protein
MGKLGGRRRHCLRSGEPRCPPDEESGSIDTSQRPNLPQLRFAPDPQQKGSPGGRHREIRPNSDGRAAS